MTSCLYDSPIGRLYIEADETGVCAIRVAGEADKAPFEPDTRLLTLAVRQLEEYFSGVRTSFDLPLSLRGTPFERLVWQTLCAIPHGDTRTYGEIAAAGGRSGASRAVGRACGANPVLIVVPCHRVIGAGGRLTGFAAGMDAKRRLLALEGYNVTMDRIKSRNE